MVAKIAGISSWYPDEVLYNNDWPQSFIEHGKKDDRIFNDIPQSIDDVAKITNKYLSIEANDPFLGVIERRYANETISAVDAECFAAELALKDAGMKASQIDFVISYSAVPDRITPTSGNAVAHRLGIQQLSSCGIDAACGSAIPQLNLAAALVESGRASNVLITQSHLLLRAFPFLHPARPGVGDAATAIIVSSEGRWSILQSHSVVHGDAYKAVTWIRSRKEDQDLPWYKAGGPYQTGSLDSVKAKDLMRDTVSFAVQTISDLAIKTGISIEQIDLIASVQPRGWTPIAACELLGLPTSIVSSVYETKGHLGACGPIANLDEAYRKGRTKDASLCVLYAQGAGFIRGAILLRMDK